jgi:excinuclease ABC subunit B
MGRASRNVNGKVILFADRVTDSMKSAIDETSRRRKIQETHNQDHGITPKTVRRKIGEDLKVYDPLQDVKVSTKLEESSEMNVEELEAKMHQAAAELNFEEAARLRDLLQSKGV